MAWFDRYDFSPAPCMPCCVVPVTCYLTLPPPIGASPYANITEATAVIANQTAGCLVFANADFANGGHITSLAASSASNSAIVNYVGLDASALSAVGKVWVGCQVEANTYLNVAYSSTSDTYDTEFTFSNGSSAGSISGASGSVLINVADNIACEFVCSNVFGAGDMAIDVNIFSPTSVNFCGIRAAYGNVPDYVVCA